MKLSENGIAMNSLTIYKSTDRYVFGLIIICCFAFFVHNDVLSLNIMEARNLVTAREMVSENHWLLPTMNGELRLEKPPLPTWIAAMGWMISPQNIFLQRSLAGLVATLLILYFYLTGVLLFKSRVSAFLSSIVLCTSYCTILIGRTASWDIYCHSMMMIGIYFLAKAQDLNNHGVKDCLKAGLFFGLSLLSKGPISFYTLLLPFVLSFLFVYRQLHLEQKQWVVLLATTLLVGGWWYVYVFIYKMDNSIQAFSKESINWISYNTRSWYYYWSFFIECGIWLFLLLLSLVTPLWNGTSWKNKKYLFPLCWVLTGLLFLSLIPEKKTRYLFPIILPCCYLMGNTITYWINHAYDRSMHYSSRCVFRLNVVLIAAIIFAIPFFCYIRLYQSGDMPTSFFIGITTVVLYIEFELLLSALRIDPIRWIKNVLLFMMYLECTMWPFLKKVFDNPEKSSIAQMCDLTLLHEIPFYHSDKEEIRMEIVYAANKRIRSLDFSCADSIINKLPMVILTHNPIDEEVPAEMWSLVDSIHLGCFDDNYWPKENRLYSSQFIYHATFINKK